VEMMHISNIVGTRLNIHNALGPSGDGFAYFYFEKWNYLRLKRGSC